MKYTVTLEIHSPSKHMEDIEINRDLLQYGIIKEWYPNFTREEFILELTKRLHNFYREGKNNFEFLSGQVEGNWFGIVQDMNNPGIYIRGYSSKDDFDNGDSYSMSGDIDFYGSSNPTHEQLVSLAELVLVYLGIAMDEPSPQDELHVLSELGK